MHTHPAGIPDPSGTDVATTRNTLELNPHLGRLVIAVVTKGAPREHDLPVGPDHRMSLHVLSRDHRGKMSLARVRGVVVPLAADLAAAGITIVSATSITAWRRRRRGGAARPRAVLPTVVMLNHSLRLAIPVPAPRAAALLIDPGYPQTGPIAVTGHQAAASRAELQPLPSSVDPVAPPGPQLPALARAATGRRVARLHQTGLAAGRRPVRRVLVAGAGSVGDQHRRRPDPFGCRRVHPSSTPTESMRRTWLAPYTAPPTSACPNPTRSPSTAQQLTRPWSWTVTALRWE